MRRFTICTTVALVALAGAAMMAQARMIMEEYAKLMKASA
jgi:hypothetical protein